MTTNGTSVEPGNDSMDDPATLTDSALNEAGGVNTAVTDHPVAGVQDIGSELTALRESVVETETVGAQIDALIDSEIPDVNRESRPQAFVVMPFGLKPDRTGKMIDFNAVYRELIKPALIIAGFEPSRADEESMSGDILTDMFQELLLADLVVADMSIDNANVFYELGVRHAFRKRGVVHIQSGRDYMPFDVFNVRTIAYQLNDDGQPDAESLEKDKENIIRSTRNTWASDADAVHSPIFNLLTGLHEPNRRSLTTPLATGFWREYTNWKERIAIAHRQKRIGDIMLLTEEISNPLIKEEAISAAGEALEALGRQELALNEYRKGLKLNPKNLSFRQEEALLLNDLGRVDAAIVKLEGLMADEPHNTVTTRYLGRIYTKLWQDYWWDEYPLERRRQIAFDAYQWIIKSVDTYLVGFRANLNNYEMGIKALMLSGILLDLESSCAVEGAPPDPDIERIRNQYDDLSSTLRFNFRIGSNSTINDYWTLVSVAEWHLIQNESDIVVTRAYRKALSHARRNVGYLRFTEAMLEMCVRLGFRAQIAQAVREILQAEIYGIEAEDNRSEPREYPRADTDVLAFLFAGHGLDQPHTKTARFPAAHEGEVRYQIDRTLLKRNADANDHAFLSGAGVGSEIIFIEACLARGMTIHIHLPCNEAEYIQNNIRDGEWRDRYYNIRNHSSVKFYYQQERVGASGKDRDPYVRNIRWTLYCSLVLGIEKLRLIALWDGKTDTAEDEDGRRVGSMVEQMRQLGGRVDHLDLTKFDYLFDHSENLKLELSSDCKVSISERSQILRQASMFDSFNSVDLQQIAVVLVEKTFSRGELLGAQGQSGTSLYFIASGEVSIVVNDENIARRKAGDYIGEMAIFPDKSRTATMLAASDVVVLELARSDFERILKERPESKNGVTKMLSLRLQEANARLARLAKES